MRNQSCMGAPEQGSSASAIMHPTPRCFYLSSSKIPTTGKSTGIEVIKNIAFPKALDPATFVRGAFVNHLFTFYTPKPGVVV
jgi:hypothetical protein